MRTKVLFSLTKRQLICFGLGGAAAFPVYLLTKGALGVTGASLCLMAVILPFFFAALFERDEKPLEVWLRDMVTATFLRPRKRPYASINFYDLPAREDERRESR